MMATPPYRAAGVVVILCTLLATLGDCQLYGWTPSEPTVDNPSWIPAQHWEPQDCPCGKHLRFKGTLLTNEVVTIINQWSDGEKHIYRSWRNRYAHLYSNPEFFNQLKLDALYLSLATLGAADLGMSRMSIPLAIPIEMMDNTMDVFVQEFPGLWADYELQMTLMQDLHMDWELYRDIMHDEMERHRHLPHIYLPLEAYMADLEWYETGLEPRLPFQDNYLFMVVYVLLEKHHVEHNADGSYTKHLIQHEQITYPEYQFWLADFDRADQVRRAYYYDQLPPLKTYVDVDDSIGVRDYIRWHRFGTEPSMGWVWDCLAWMVVDEYIAHSGLPHARQKRVHRAPPPADRIISPPDTK